MQDNVGELYVSNGVVEISAKAGELDARTNRIVYEVIRIIDGVPLFYEDHYRRLVSSMKALDMKLEITEKELKEQIKILVNANKETNCNVKVCIYNEAGIQKYRLYISKSHYPSKEEVEQGVKVGLFHWERKNPNVKVIDQTYKEEAARLISENNLYEVLLVDKNGKITEGSKSNVFFVKGDKIFTAPSESVLMGITRKYIIQTCTRLGFEVIETFLNVDALKDVEGLFISGTSIKVLPVSHINELSFNSANHPTIVAVRNAFDAFINGYIHG